MPPSRDHTILELLLTEPDRADPRPIVLVPEAPGAGIEAIARSPAESLDEGRRRLLPVPGFGDDVVAQRAWHRDLWLAMPAADRAAVALVSGATAAYLAPVLGDAARTVVLVSDPPAAIAMIAGALPKRRQLERLAETPVADLPKRLQRIANPQSRALLGPWHDPGELTVSLGPPRDADRWRQALFDDVLPHLDARPMPRAAVEAPTDPQLTELLLKLNWLDAELYERCAAAQDE